MFSLNWSFGHLDSSTYWKTTVVNRASINTVNLVLCFLQPCDWRSNFQSLLISILVPTSSCLTDWMSDSRPAKCFTLFVELCPQCVHSLVLSKQLFNTIGLSKLLRAAGKKFDDFHKSEQSNNANNYDGVRVEKMIWTYNQILRSYSIWKLTLISKAPGSVKISYLRP